MPHEAGHDQKQATVVIFKNLKRLPLSFADCHSKHHFNGKSSSA
jgi:hypothetical protein